MSLAQNVRQFMRSAGSTIISAEFVKKDGTIRKVRFNPRDRNEISGFGSKVNDPNIIRIRDLDLAKKGIPAWRSFNVNNLRVIRSRNSTFKFGTVE